MALEVVDAHHHLWDLTAPFKYPWLNGPHPGPRVRPFASHAPSERARCRAARPDPPHLLPRRVSSRYGGACGATDGPAEGGDQVRVIKSVHVQADAADDLAEVRAS